MSTPLQPSLASLQQSTALLNSSLSILDAGTKDLPRMTRVLQQTRHFELTPSSELASAQQAVLSELVPEVEQLLARVEAVIERREGREEWLRARWALGEGRLGRDVGSLGGGGSEETVSAKKKQKLAARTGKPTDSIKATRLRQKKERLSYAVDRLQLQAQQRERQLRMSMAKHDASGMSGGSVTQGDSD